MKWTKFHDLLFWAGIAFVVFSLASGNGPYDGRTF